MIADVPLDTWGSQFTVIEGAIAKAREDFGPVSTVLAHYQFLKLAMLLHQGAIAVNFATDVVSTLSQIAQLTFGVNDVAGVVEDAVDDAIPCLCYSFPEASYSPEYRTASTRFRKVIMDRVAFVPEHQYLFNKFTYVLGTKSQWRYCIVPQSIRTALMGNRDQSTAPFHPILAEDLGLEVAVAGEVSFRWNEESSEPSIVHANNISGHFMPKDWRSEHLNLTLRRALSLTGRASVICLANDGYTVSGPLANDLGLIENNHSFVGSASGL